MSTLDRELERLLFVADKVYRAADAEGRRDAVMFAAMVVRLVPIVLGRALPEDEFGDMATAVSHWRQPGEPGAKKRKGAK